MDAESILAKCQVGTYSCCRYILLLLFVRITNICLYKVKDADMCEGTVTHAVWNVDV